MFEEVNHLLMAVALAAFVVSFIIRSYKNYRNWAPTTYYCSKPLTKRGWTWLLLVSTFEAVALSTTVTALCWITTMLIISI